MPPSLLAAATRHNAVGATGRRKFLIAALWTEVCLVFPALDLLNDGYDVYAVSDASGGTSVDAHERDAIERLRQTGNPKALQIHLGHTSPFMTMRYLSTLTAEDALRIQQHVEFD